MENQTLKKSYLQVTSVHLWQVYGEGIHGGGDCRSSDAGGSGGLGCWRCGTWLLMGLVQEERDGNEGACYCRPARRRSRPEYEKKVREEYFSLGGGIGP
jgi:hypothetical protein